MAAPQAPAPVITGRGAFLPADVLTNDDVAGLLGPDRLGPFVQANTWCARHLSELAGGGAPTPALLARAYADFVAERLGIGVRRVIDREAILAGRPSVRGVLASDLGAEAGRRALADAGLRPGDLDVVVCGSSSPDRVYPGTAVRLQSLLGAERAYAFDVGAACSSFVFALAAARALVLSGGARRVLVVAAEAFTHGVDWADPASACFFGDGAGAVVLEDAAGARGRPGFAVLDVACWSSFSENIRTGLGGSGPFVQAQQRNGHARETTPGAEGYPFFFQDGPAVFRDLIPAVHAVVAGLLGRQGRAPGDVRAWLLHQASAVMLDALERRALGPLGPGARAPRNLARYGNTSSAGAALALAEEPPPTPGELSCVLTFGGGYAVGAALLRGVAG